MKKGFWGYNVAEADQLIDSLQNKNDILTTKVTDLTMQLDQLNKKMAEAEQQQLPVKEVLKQEEFECRLRQAELENQELRRQLGEARASGAAQANTDGLVGQLCERAYRDMEHMKKETAQEIQRQVEAYAKQVEGSNQELRKVMANVETAYEDTAAYLSDFVRQLYEGLKAVKDGGLHMEETCRAAEAVAGSLKARVSAELSGEKTPEPEPRQEAAEQKSTLENTLELLSESLQKAKAAETDSLPAMEGGRVARKNRVIGIHTNVKPNDVLGD